MSVSPIPVQLVDRSILAADFDALAAITEPDKPWTRRSFTQRYVEGRGWLAERFAEVGLEVTTDAAGNMIGRWQGQDPTAPVLMIGSHTDTVPDGGRYDGTAGVLTGLAGLRALRASGYTPRHTLELVDFLAEEPSEWGLSCIGSRGMAGALGARELALVGPDNELLADAIERMGGSVAELQRARRSDIAGFLELHIEQGPVLEAENISVAIVTGIAGIARLRIRFAGTAAHAGTAPMGLRHDAGLALARFALALRATAVDRNASGHVTATIGVQRLEPGGANVVPGAAEAILDLRAETDRALTDLIDGIPGLATAAASAEGCRVESIEELSRGTAVQCDPRLRACIREAAKACGASSRTLTSGAGHDAAFVARIAPAAMIFVPSRDGKSHCPEEWTDPNALAIGADVLLNALCFRDQAEEPSTTPD